MADVDKHAQFHAMIDDLSRTLDAVESDSAQALEKAEYATNVLYNRGLD